ncbi:NAD(P)/FAD-dependent oxidoreductase [Leeia oryzae]|uniref:NAD(P)/FAD-dependent oxidoreductase n=1 Tax=Leeia oryzae TaxID=356662 RepID=UPI0003788786|nr:FAD-binding oxidoreductase [Leeia oryzae]
MNQNYDYIVIGAGVIGTSTAFHLAKLGAKNVLLIDRGQVGEGTTSQSSGILRTHYSVVQNVEIAKHSWDVFKNFSDYLEDPEASCGLVKCGYMITSPDNDKLGALKGALDAQRDMGIQVDFLSRAEAKELLPIAQFEDSALIGYEPEAGFADAYLVASSFAAGARKRGVDVKQGVAVTGLIKQGNKVVGIQTTDGEFYSSHIVSTQNIWSGVLKEWTGIDIPLVPERHAVMSLECAGAAYTYEMPVYKDLGSPGMLYCRSYGGNQMLVSEGIVGDSLNNPETEQADIPLDYVVEVGAQVAERFPAYEAAGLASSWTGVYDVTPDWNPVMGFLPGIEGFTCAFGFSGHGFKLSPGVGLLLAQQAMGLKTDIDLAPYAYDRFTSGSLLTGKYGLGAVS